MSDDIQQLIGRTGQPFEMVVERGKILEFARATKSKNPAYLEDKNAVTPATFFAAAQHWLTAESAALHGVPMDFSNMLHGEQEYVFHGEPPRVGTVLQCQQRVENIFTKEGKRGGEMRFTVLVTDFRDEAGTLRAEARTTIIQTGKTPQKES